MSGEMSGEVNGEMTVDRRPPVLQLVDTLDPGGAERTAALLARHLPRDDFRPHLATTRRSGPLAALLPADVVTLHLDRRWRLDPWAAGRLRTHVVRHEVALIHAHGTSVYAAALLAATVRGLRVVAHLHSGRLATAPASRLLRWALGRADVVVTVSEELSEWVDRQAVARRVAYLPNFVEWTSAVPAPDVAAMPGPRLVCLANLRPEKDHPTLLEAFGRLVADGRAGTLLLAGAASDREYAERLHAAVRRLGLAGRVRFLGRRDDAAAVLAASDLAVLPSASEGFPLALLEYGVAGLPTVATAVGQTVEILGDGEAGVLVPAGDAGALAAALDGLLGQPLAARRRGERLADRVAGHYAVASGVGRFAALYRTVLSPPTALSSAP